MNSYKLKPQILIIAVQFVPKMAKQLYVSRDTGVFHISLQIVRMNSGINQYIQMIRNGYGISFFFILVW